MAGCRIIYNSYGQMGNRLWEYLDQIAWAMENNGKVISLFWDPSLQYFDSLRNNKYISFPFYINIIECSFFKKYYHYVLRKTLHNRYIQFLFATKFFFKLGFIKADNLLYKSCYYPDVWNDEKDLFRINTKVTHRLDCLFDSYRKNNPSCKIVGVHLRKGDYKQFCNGFFYYEDQEYLTFMEQISTLLNKKVVFFLSSNEDIPEIFELRYNLVTIKNKSAVEDMYCLSKCDYIIGPYSSFSAWASFYSNIPCYHFKRNEKILLNDFKIVKKFYPSSFFTN